MKMQLVSFFSGIGGFELAGEWMGWDIIASCEINPFGLQVLKYYWPDAYHHTDVKTINYEEIKNRLNPTKSTVFVAGFPCQPFSTAGKRLGTEDDRYGWPHCIKAVRELSPSWCVLENVRGLTNWNGGMVFDQVQADLEAEGYEVLPFLLPACAVNAPHRRDRIWFVAYSGLQRQEKPEQQPMGSEQLRESGIATDTNSRRSGTGAESMGWQEGANADRCCERATMGIATYSGGQQLQERSQKRNTENTTEGRARVGNWIERQGNTGIIADTTQPDKQRHRLRQECEGLQVRGRNSQRNGFDNFPTVSPLCGRNDGFSLGLSGITFPKWRNEGLKAMGNAVVPQVVYQIFKAIEEYENLQRDTTK